jgi:hypothetical protein
MSGDVRRTAHVRPLYAAEVTLVRVALVRYLKEGVMIWKNVFTLKRKHGHLTNFEKFYGYNLPESWLDL